MGLFGKLLGADKISLLKAEITVLLLFFVLSIAGCGGGGYAIKKSTDDQFSDKSLPILITGVRVNLNFYYTAYVYIYRLRENKWLTRKV